jgi:5-methylcytosine-specific restriction endonuclease McrA
MTNDEKKEYQKKYYLANRDALIKKADDYRRENCTRVNAYRKGYYQRNKEKMANQSKKIYQNLSPALKWARGSIYSHKYAGYTVDISKERLLEIVSTIKNCQLCGVELKYNTGRQYDNITLDRMNNGTEINENNILIICRQCNNTKGSRTMSEFYEYCQKIANKDFTQWRKND